MTSQTITRPGYRVEFRDGDAIVYGVSGRILTARPQNTDELDRQRRERESVLREAGYPDVIDWTRG